MFAAFDWLESGQHDWRTATEIVSNIAAVAAIVVVVAAVVEIVDLLVRKNWRPTLTWPECFADLCFE